MKYTIGNIANNKGKMRNIYIYIYIYIYMHSCTGTEALYRPYAHRGSRGIALLFLGHGTRRGWGVSVTPRPLFTPGKDPVPIVQEAGWALGPVWTGVENLAPPGFDPRTVQPVASRYNNWATRPTEKYTHNFKYRLWMEEIYAQNGG